MCICYLATLCNIMFQEEKYPGTSNCSQGHRVDILHILLKNTESGVIVKLSLPARSSSSWRKALFQWCFGIWVLISPNCFKDQTHIVNEWELWDSVPEKVPITINSCYSSIDIRFHEKNYNQKPSELLLVDPSGQFLTYPKTTLWFVWLDPRYHCSTIQNL